MTDRALENAEIKRNQLLERKRALREQIGSVDRQLSAVEVFIANWHEFANTDPESPVDNATVMNENIAGTTQAVSRKAKGNSRKEDVAAAAREAILERGAPIMRDELFELLTERGLIIQGKDPKMVLSTMLWRMRAKIVRLKSGGYWPADVISAENGYSEEVARDMFAEDQAARQEAERISVEAADEAMAKTNPDD